ncbi:MAG: DMT family transporter [Verrucomicrobiales bacterium]|nr:DMT family transporter [Verrucomicrobiales bacterium]
MESGVGGRGRPRWADYLQLHLVVLAWGLTAVLGRLVTLPAWQLVVYRTFLAALGFGALAWWRGAPLRIGGREVLKLMGLGAVLGVHWVLFFTSARLANASVCLAAMPTVMLWSSLIEPLVDGSRRWRWVELLVGGITVGAVWMMYQVQLDAWRGFTVGLAAALTAAIFSVVNKQVVSRWPGPTLGFYQMLGGTVASLVCLPLLTEKGEPWLRLPTVQDAGWILILAWVCTVAAVWGYMDALRRVSVFTVNVIYNLEPIYGMVLAVGVFGSEEVLRPGFYIGVGIIIVSVMLLPWLERWRGGDEAS